MNGDENALHEAFELLFIARAAANKLKTAYMRREVEPRHEYDRPLDANERIRAWLEQQRVRLQR